MDIAKKHCPPRSGRATVLALACAAAAGWGVATSAAAAAGMTRAEVEAKYQQDRANCLSGNTVQARDVCLREAGAARDEGLRGHLTSDATVENRNALTRCDGLPGEDRDLCRLRIQGAGTVTGSVAQGGMLRELVVIEPAPTAAGMPAP